MGESSFPLSAGQRGLWFLHELAEDSCAYHVPVRIDVDGELDVRALLGAWQAVAQRHESLRTVVTSVCDEPVGRTTSEVPSGVVRDVTEAELAARVSAEATALFRLAVGPLARLTVWRRGPRHHTVLLVAHHIVCDAWSLELIFADLAHAYRALRDGSSVQWPRAPGSYRGFVRRQQEVLAADGDRLLSYWRDRLAELPNSAVLPGDHPAPATPRFRGAEIRFGVDADVAAAFGDVVRANRVSTYMGVLAVLAMTVAVHTGAHRVVVGVPVAARAEPEQHDVVGYCLNTVPVVVDLAGAASFRDLLPRVRQSCVDAYRHQDLPLDRLVTQLRLDRTTPPFDSMLVVQREEVPSLELAGTTTTSTLVPTHSAKVGVSVHVYTGGDGFGVVVEYDTDRYDGPTVSAFADHFRSLLRTVAADPDMAFDLGAVGAAHEECVDVPSAPTTADQVPAPGPALLAELCAIFADVLGVPSVDADDNFFELGGHSLLAIRLVARIRARFGRPLAVGAVLAAPTAHAVARLLGTQEGDARPALGPQRIGERPVLSFAQSRLHFLHQMPDLRTAYQVPVATRLSGDLDFGAVAAALADVLVRHEVLCTVYPDDDGEPWQRVLTGVRPDMRVVPVTEEELPAALTRATLEEFDLAVTPPLRAVLFALGERDHVLLLVLHHIATDAWSLPVLAADLATAYTARLTGAPPHWSPPRVRYVDYATWQRRTLAGEGAPPGEYWTERLAGLPERIPLPGMRSTSATASHHGDTVEFTVPAQPHAALLALATKHDCTLFMVLHAGVTALLTRMGAGTDVPVGCPVTGRTDEATHDLVGLFLNTVVLRVDTSGDPSFAELLARVRETDLAAYNHQDVPFEYLVERLNPVRATTHHPLFQVLLTLQDSPVPCVHLPGTEARPVTVATGTARMDLVLTFTEQFDGTGTPAGLSGEVEYRTDLFAGVDMARFPERLARVLAVMTEDADRHISSVDPLLPGERERLTALGTREAATPAARTLPELFEAQVAATPDLAALVSADSRWTYAEVDAMANRLAWCLIGRGIGTEDVVAIVLPRSPDAVVAVLGVLKAGAGYLPVDPANPPDRIGYLLDDSAPALVVTAANTRGRVRRDLPTLVWAAADEPSRELPPGNPTDRDRVRPVHDDSPAYVIYTSGSTGLPKGVVLPARALVNLLTWHRTAVPGGPGVRTAQFAAIGFDVAAEEALVALTTGRTLVVPPEEIRGRPDELAEWLATRRINELYATQLTIDALAEVTEGAAVLPDLHDIVQAGEPFVLTQRTREFLAGRRVHNFYGPTETHVVTTHTAAGGPEEWPAALPIGVPVPATTVHVLDDRLCLAPPGVAGELYIGGVQVARGYHGRPRQTAERFVPDPFGFPGQRLYRTGDRVRWTEQGELEYLERADDQVKVRGYRIELGEVAAALTRHPLVRDAAAAVHTGPSGDGRLVGYVVTAGDLPVPELRAFLTDWLPPHMLPSVITVLPDLPRTTSGKLDRRALPVPDAGRPDTGSALREPVSDLERQVCQAWRTVLGMDSVGTEDNFFDLGGHSAVLLRLRSHLAAATGVTLGVVDLFRYPTVAAQARAIARSGAAESRSGADGEPRGLTATGRQRLGHRRARLALDREAES